ncbi:Conserved hypothetical protein [Bradyrhizobium sp. ORS 278]|uniref:hypothetical protein n=1 Tax=Bradyrhizobium sp. (strain ORS 278) TaxID=114615 RepID=UPI0001507C65|nr:hypothetical protein [Bradyrhizobium sp. ORS 278]CAL74562.1 Conserved hypothetical protein [Bradyrhizobium sp. ORS 278]
MLERRPTAAVLEAHKAFKQAPAPKSDYEKAQSAFNENRERLRAERLAREAAAAKSDQIDRKQKPA